MDGPSPLETETLARMARQHFLQSLCASIPELDRLVVRRFEAASESGFRDLLAETPAAHNWLQEYMHRRRNWAQGLLAIWRAAFADPVAVRKRQTLDSATSIEELQLLSDEAIDEMIVSSRVSMQVAEKIDPAFAELRKRLLRLEGQRLDANDPVQPTVVAENLVEAWQRAGLPKNAFVWAMEGIAGNWAALLLKAYRAANTFLEERGIAPVQAAPPARADHGVPQGGPVGHAGAGQPGWGASPTGAVQMPWGPPGAPFAGPMPTHPSGGMASVPMPASQMAMPATGMGAPPQQQPVFLAPQMVVPAGTPLAVAAPVLSAPQAQFGQPAIEQLNALCNEIRSRMMQVIGSLPAQGVASGLQAAPNTGLVQAMHAQQAQAVRQLEQVAAQTSLMRAPAVAGPQIAELARQQSEALKQEAAQPNEKAVIEMVALMFQSVLSEDRVPASVRVLFARLQVPVLRIALADAAFFSDIDHPVRRLIDRMGSAAMGFDGANFQGSTLEHELRRIVQMIEQYPDTGVKVFQLALSEFEKFLQKYLSEHRLAGKAMSVAQQVEEKETLLVKFTIELRRMLDDIPIRDELRSFLFKTWAEVLAVSAVRGGAKGPETLRFKQAASLLVWATSAKPSKAQRRRVAQALPKLLERLRAGLTLVGVVDMAQEAAITQISGLVQEAFLARAQAVPAERLRQVAERLENLENIVGHDAVDDIALTPENIEMMLGMELAGLVVLEEPGGHDRPLPAEVLDWARARAVGEWFRLGMAEPGVSAGDAEEAGLRVQYVWHSRQRHLHVLLAADGRSFLLKLRTLAAYFEQGRLVPLDQEGLMLRATRVALTQYQPLGVAPPPPEAMPVPQATVVQPLQAQPMPPQDDGTRVVPLAGAGRAVPPFHE